ncbi:Rho GTPase activation protein, partial [Entophlyctis helioformis]
MQHQPPATAATQTTTAAPTTTSTTASASTAAAGTASRPPGSLDVGDGMTDEEIRRTLSDNLLTLAGPDRKGRPMYCFYCCNLPTPQSVNYDKLLELLLERLSGIAAQEYTIVLFAGGAPHYPSWSWTLQAYSKLSRSIRKNLKALYVVHPAMWPKFLLQTMGMIVSPKFASKLIWVDNLARLASLVPMGGINLPLVIQEYNNKQESSTALGMMSFSRKPTANKPAVVRTQVFEEPLDELMGHDGSKGCPIVVLECIAYIMAHGLDTEGLFRKSAASTSLQEAKRLYNLGKSPDFDALGGVHVASGLLKMWFRELPEPIFPLSTYTTVRGVETAANKVEFIRKQFLPCLSIPTQLLLCEVFRLLNLVLQHSEANRMTAVNLTIVWSPNFVKSDNMVLDLGMCAIGVQGAGIGSTVKTCIESFDEIFGDEVANLQRSDSVSSGSDSSESAVGEAAAAEDPSVPLQPLSNGDTSTGPGALSRPPFPSAKISPKSPAPSKTCTSPNTNASIESTGK